MRGRKATPIPADPAAERTPPLPPELTGDAVAEWKRVAPLLHARGTLTELDRGMLAAYCQAYGRWCAAERAIAEIAKRNPTAALIIQTKNGNPIQNPLIGIANKALSDMARFSAELGMTPSARARVSGGEKLGKKEEQQERAKDAARGRFAPPPPPTYTVQ